jgi:hypothetical protein
MGMRMREIVQAEEMQISSAAVKQESCSRQRTKDIVAYGLLPPGVFSSKASSSILSVLLLVNDSELDEREVSIDDGRVKRLNQVWWLRGGGGR